MLRWCPCGRHSRQPCVRVLTREVQPGDAKVCQLSDWNPKAGALEPSSSSISDQHARTWIIFCSFCESVLSSGRSKGYAPTSITYSITPQLQMSATCSHVQKARSATRYTHRAHTDTQPGEKVTHLKQTTTLAGGCHSETTAAAASLRHAHAHALKPGHTHALALFGSSQPPTTAPAFHVNKGYCYQACHTRQLTPNAAAIPTGA
jgi:hypothetical protein